MYSSMSLSGSVAAFHARSIRLELTACPVKLPGAVGGVPSRVVADASGLFPLSWPNEFTDRTR